MIILPCSFCGEEPIVPDDFKVFGASCVIKCKCGMAVSSVQMSDVMTQEERWSDEFDGFMYPPECPQRALNYCIKRWNTRA